MKQLLLLLPLIFTSCKVSVTPQPLFHPAVKNSLSTKSPEWVDSLTPEELNRTNGFGRSALTYAVLQGNVPLAKKLVEKGVDLHSKDQWELSPLEYSALFKGRNVKFDFPDSLTAKIDTTAVLQAWQEQEKMLGIILNNLNAGDFKKGAEYIPFADLHTPTGGSRPPYGSFFTGFLRENKYEISRFLLEEVKLYPDACGSDGVSGFQLIDPDSSSMVDLLMSVGADLNSSSSWGLHLSTTLLRYEDTLLYNRFEKEGMRIHPAALEGAVKKGNRDLILWLAERTSLADSSRAKYSAAELNDSTLLNALFDSVTYDDKLIRILTSEKNDQTLPWLLARDIPLADSTLLKCCKVSLNETALNNLISRIDDSLVVSAMNRAVHAKNMGTAAALLSRLDTLPDSLKNYPAEKAGKIDSTFAKLLVKRGADINLPSKNGEGAIQRALFERNNELIHWLIKEGADLNRRSQNGSTPLMLSAAYKNREIMDLLLDSGADRSLKADNGRGFLFDLIHRDSSYETVVTDLLKNGGDTLAIAGVHEKDSSGITLFIEMCEEKDTAALNFYLKLTEGSGFPRKEELGVALVKAARNRDPLAFLLIDRGASLDLQDQYGNTPLHNALEKKFDTLSTLLIEKGADLNKKNMHGMTPLFSLLWIDQYEQYRSQDLAAMNALIDSGADLSFINKKGEGVLSYISDKSVSLDLIKRGAPVDVRTVDSLLIATVIKSGDLSWATAVIEKSKKLNAICDEFGNTPLALAISRNRVEIARALIKKGAKRTHPSVKRAAKHVTNSDMKALLKEQGIL